MPIEQLLAKLEAVLYAAGDEVAMEKLAAALSIPAELLEVLSRQVIEQYNERPGGLLMLRLGDSLQLCTREEHAALIRQVLASRKKSMLTPAAMEVLAITAYNQPVTRAYMEQVRGVDCSAVVIGLVEKGLMEECGRLDAPGRPLLYQTTPGFLRVFGISSLDQLPDLGMLQQSLLDLPDESAAEDGEEA